MTDQKQTWAKKTHCKTAKSPALSVRWTVWDCVKLHPFHVITIFLAFTLKNNTTDMPEHQRGISQIIFTLHPKNLYIKWKQNVYISRQSKCHHDSQSVYLSKPICPFLLLLTQAGTWQVTVSQAEEVILFWGREDMQNMLLLYSPGHYVLILQVWNRVTNVLSFPFSPHFSPQALKI